MGKPGTELRSVPSAECSVSVLCTVCGVQCAVFSVRCTVCGVQYSVISCSLQGQVMMLAAITSAVSLIGVQVHYRLNGMPCHPWSCLIFIKMWERHGPWMLWSHCQAAGVI